MGANPVSAADAKVAGHFTHDSSAAEFPFREMFEPRVPTHESGDDSMPGLQDIHHPAHLNLSEPCACYYLLRL